MRARLIKRKLRRKPTKRLPTEWVLLTRVKSPLHVAVAATRAEFDEEELEQRREEFSARCPALRARGSAGVGRPGRAARRSQPN
jgi:hypothetical protein